ncbi:uncharacterized protein N7506_006930 [Penicillium brevicompactum]|uniref:uncharacterized protein n=1 Tax=Penicillium brevicompactum TaxID=5074 RepID=UPI00254174D4|nr:uncharacterized protein N7506_006930 [Penicillium brevicompactum]KAJ5333147.1 hypothetical protein N7506_006930 [Penicillium brevicompactum]
MSFFSSLAAWSSPEGYAQQTTTINPTTNHDESTTIIGDGSTQERDLQKRGDINTLQRLRYKTYLIALTDSNTTDSSLDLLNTEQELRELVQEETAIRESLNQDHNLPATERLQFLNTQYHVLSQKWWHYRSNLELMGQERGFELWRSHPQWYMHRELVMDCIRRQGCCAPLEQDIVQWNAGVVRSLAALNSVCPRKWI